MIYQQILHFADTTPNHTAIRRNSVDLSYRDFAEAVEMARSDFAQRGVIGQKVVGVAVVDIQKFWVCAIALRSLGMTVLPIRSPDDLADLSIPGLKYVVGNVSWTHLTKRCQDNGLTVVPLPSLSAYARSVVCPPLGDGGQILLTSGTTGKWKMVLWNSAADDEALSWGVEVDRDTMYHIFDYGPWTAAGYLIPIGVWSRGGAIIVNQTGPRHQALLDADGTHALVLPFFLSEILAAPEDAFPYNNSLKLYLAGGTVTESQLQEAARRISPNLFNRLASTEIGGIACTPLKEGSDRLWHAVPLQRGVQIVDDHDQPVEVGHVGRLRVPVGTGPSEYYEDQEATAAFFREGYFYPGDLAVARAGGQIALQGRTSEVINVNGIKIAPAPYEDLLRERHGLTGVCLISAQDARGQEQVYVVVETQQPLEDNVVSSLQAIVQDVPVRVCTMSSLPRTGTGKVIRRDLQSRILANANREQSNPFAICEHGRPAKPDKPGGLA